MAHLLLEWLNDEVVLSREVHDFKDEFKDGFLIGEILYKFNQQLNFDQFAVAKTPLTVLKNFRLLEPSLNKIGIKFNAKIATDVIDGNEAVSKQLIYELKSALGRISRNCKQTTSQTMRGTKNDKILNVIPSTNPVFDKTRSSNFDAVTRKKVESANHAMMEETLKRFKDRETELYINKRREEVERDQKFLDERQRKVDTIRTQKSHIGEFSDAWDTINMGQWQKNQEIAQERKNLKKRVVQKATKKKNKILEDTLIATRSKTLHSIDEFDKRLEANMVTHAESNIPGSTPQNSMIKTIKNQGVELMYLDQTVLKGDLEKTKKKIQEHHEESSMRAKRNERRRGKSLRIYENMQTDIAKDIFDGEVTAKLLVPAKSEVEEDGERRKVTGYKEIIVDNRSNRQMLMDGLAADQEAMRVEWEKTETKRELEWVVGAQQASAFERGQTLRSAVAATERRENTNFIHEVLEQVLNLTEWVVACRHVGLYHYKLNAPAKPSEAGEAAPVVSQELNPWDIKGSTSSTAAVSQSSLIPDILWRDAVKMITTKGPNGFFVAEGMPEPAAIPVSSALWPFSISERPQCSEKDWLFQGPFDSRMLLLLREADSTKADEGGVKDLAATLADADTKEFLKRLFDSDIAGAGHSVTLTEEAPQVVSAPKQHVVTIPPTAPVQEEGSTEGSVEPVLEIDTLFTPKWHSKVLPKHLLGETVISVRRVVDPLPEHPQALLDTGHIPLRLAICGLSYPTRQKMALALEKQIPGLKVFRVEQIVNQCFQYVTAKTEETEIVDKDYDELATAIYTSLFDGSGISDELYVKVLVYSIRQIPSVNNGYVIVDFPNTKEQAVLLMEAHAGVRYDTKPPQPADKASLFAPCSKHEVLRYDIKRCGIDALIYIQDGEAPAGSNQTPGGNIVVPLQERLRSRIKTSDDSSVRLQDDQPSVVGLTPAYIEPCTQHSQWASGVDLTKSDIKAKELVEFMEDVQILDRLVIKEFPSLDEAVEGKAKDLCSKFIPTDHLTDDYLVQLGLKEPVVDVEAIAAAEKAVVMAEVTASFEVIVQTLEEMELMEKNDSPAEVPEGEPVKPTLVERTKPVEVITHHYEVPVTINHPNSVPPRLADVLNRMWDVAEKHSKEKTDGLFRTFRDVRYKMVQRRRAAFDCLSSFLVRLDRRQELFDKFRENFNSMDDDQRFEPECMAELHLQALELGDEISKLSENRRTEAEECVKKVGGDGMLRLLIHRCQCEAASMAQTKLQRFFVVLHLLFDVSKAVKGYQVPGRILSELEETLPMVVPGADTGKSKGGKEKKKGKDVSSFEPYREPMPALFIPEQIMGEVPLLTDVNGEEKDAKGKAKAPAKGKKGGAGDGTPADPFVEVEKKVLEELEKWKKGTFTVNRELYENDESVCVALENAIWYEAEKFSSSMNRVKVHLLAQCKWLEEAEVNLVNIMNDMVFKRYYKELAAINYLIDLIIRCIGEAQPMHDLWLVSPEANPVNPKHAWRQFYRHLPEHLRPAVLKAHRYEGELEDVLEDYDDDGDGSDDDQDDDDGEEGQTNRDLPDYLMEGPDAPSEEHVDSLMHVINATEQTKHRRKEKGIEKGNSRHGKMTDDKSGRLGSFGGSSMSLGSYSSDAEGSHTLGNRSKSGRSVSSAGILARGGSAHKSHRHGHRRPRTPDDGRTRSHRHSSAGQQDVKGAVSQAEEQYKKEQEKYLAARHKFEEKLLRRREQREEEFKGMGMSPSCAKLAAYNELLLDEEHQMEDFEAHNKPTHHRQTHSAHLKRNSTLHSHNPHRRTSREAHKRPGST